MPTKIKINRKSVKKNPNAGQSVHHLPGRITITQVMITGECTDGGAVYRKRTYIGSKLSPDKQQLVDGHLVGEETRTIEYNNAGQFPPPPPPDWKDSISVNTSIQEIHSLTPQPNWLYEYEDAEVECSICRSEFPWEKLESDYGWDADDEIYSNSVCPECGAWECCEIEFEKLSDKELEAIAKLNKPKRRKK